jgi:hypothetical protein
VAGNVPRFSFFRTQGVLSCLSHFWPNVATLLEIRFLRACWCLIVHGNSTSTWRIPTNGVTMFDPTHPGPIWLVWPFLSFLERLFFLALMVLGIYVLFLAATTVLRIRKAASSLRDGLGTEAEELFIALRRRSTRVDRLITTAFYFFGVVLFLGLQDAYFTIDNSKTPVGWIILRNFGPHFAFASNVFFILLVLHFVGWSISYCVGRLGLRSTPQDAQ